MTTNNLVKLSKPEASIEAIEGFEKQFGLTIPSQYKNLLLLSNGAEIEGRIQSPIDENWKMILGPSLYSLEELRNGMAFLKGLKQDNMPLQYQDKLLQICATHDGPGIFIGHTSPILGQVFVDDMDELTEQGETALHLIAHSLDDFLSQIKPLSKE